MILDSGWLPDLIVLWRGGAPVGVSIHEFYHYLRAKPRVLKCQSYTGIQAREHTVTLKTRTHFSFAQAGSRVLVIDDASTPAAPRARFSSACGPAASKPGSPLCTETTPTRPP